MYTKGISKESEETLKNGYESAVFNRMQYLNLYRNNDSCGYPLHWHALNEIEFIMPVVNEFNVLCDGKQIHLKEERNPDHSPWLRSPASSIRRAWRVGLFL